MKRLKIERMKIGINCYSLKVVKIFLINSFANLTSLIKNKH